VGTLYVAQTDLKLKILLPLPPKCWSYKHAPPEIKGFIIKNLFTPMWKLTNPKICRVREQAGDRRAMN
jgi:hypothetical protein